MAFDREPVESARGMTDAAKAALRALLVRWVGFVCRRPGSVAAACLALSILGLAFVVENIAISTDTGKLISPDLPYRQGIQALKDAFPDSRDRLLVVIDGEDADAVSDTARALAGRMRARPDLFDSLIAPEDDPFFRRNGLLYRDVAAVEELADRLAAAQPFLGALSRDPSLRGLFDLLTRIAENSGSADGVAREDIVRILDSVSDVVEAQAQGRPETLSWRSLIDGEADEAMMSRRFISVAPVYNFSTMRPAEPAIEAVRTWVEELATNQDLDVSVRLTDEAALNDEELQTVAIGMGAAGFASLVAVLTLLWIAFRSPRITAAALVTLVIGLIWTAAYSVAVVDALNLISVAFAVLFIGLSVDFSIHFALRFREIHEREHTTDTSLVAATSRVGGALTLAAAAAAIGFLSFLPTDYIGLAELGIIAGGGMVIALFLNFTLLPAMIMLVRPRLRKPVDWNTTWQAILENRFRKHARPLTVVAVLLAIGSIVIGRNAYFDFDPLHLKDQESESVATLLELMDEDATRSYAISILANDIESAKGIAAEVSALPTVSSTRTVADFVATEQDLKLELLADLQLFLGPSLSATPVDPPSATDEREATERLQSAATALAASSDADLARAGGRLANLLTGALDRSAVTPGVFDDLDQRLLGRLPGLLTDLSDSLIAAAFDIDDLPSEMRERWLTDDGRALLQVYPSQPVHRDRSLLVEFVTEVQAVVPNASGAPIGIYEGGRTVLTAFIEAAVLAVVAIAAMLLFVLRSVRNTLVVFAPLILAALLTVAGSALLSIPFNFANVIVLPLLFGLGVAGSLHLVMRERAEARDATAMATSTPRAVLFSALTTIASFGSLSLSAHPGTASMGILLTVSIALVLICTLVFLPALLELCAVPTRRTKLH